MSSSIISFPNINRFINFKGRYILPTIDNKNNSYFILTNTTDKYLLTNNDINNKKINIEVFIVGGGGAGGYYYGNGGDGGKIIYKKMELKKDEILELTVGKGGYYINDNRYIQGIELRIYEGGINDLFSLRNNYIMNMRYEDLLKIGLNKKIEKNISSLSNITDYYNINNNNDISSTIINNPIDNDFNYDDNNNNNNNNNKWFNFKKGYTIELSSYFNVPYNCSIEINLEAYKYGILFFYNENDIKNGLFKKDLVYYNNENRYNSYWSKVENGKTKFNREGLKKNEMYYLKIIYSQDKEISINENNFKINMKIIRDDNKNEEYITDDSYFKYNNSINNFGIVYSTPTIIKNQNNNEIILNASGGLSGIINSLDKNFGNGGCVTYDINNNKIKMCKENGNGANGINLPKSISNELQDNSFRYYKYGSGGGGSYWKEGNYNNKGGKDGGNGVIITNIPTLSTPIQNSGGGGGGNSFINNITDRNLKINKLSGADGIIIIKVIKEMDQRLIQTFENYNNNNNDNKIIKINDKLKLLYKTDNINIYDPNKFNINLKLTIDELNEFGITTAGLFIFFGILMNNMNVYINLTEKEKMKYPIKLIFNTSKSIFFVENNYYNFNFANYNEIDYYFPIIRPGIEVKDELNKIFEQYNNKEIIYNSNLNSNSNYFNKIINELIDPSRLVLFVENTNKNFFKYFNFFMNFVFFTILYNLILAETPTNIIISKINELIQILKNFNNIYFNPIDKNSNTETDTLIKDRTYYIEQQLEYKRIYDKNVLKIEKSNQLTNYATNKFKSKYYQNKKNNWFNILFYITIVLIIISFIFSYNYLEDHNKPLVILVISIVMLIILIMIWNKAVNDLKIFEKFGCQSNDNNCYDLKGKSVTNTSLLPYYYISNKNEPIELKNKNDIIADIFVYSTPFNIKIDGIDRYYEPHIDLYKSILLPKTFSYKIYKNKIIASSPDNSDIILLQERLRENERIRNELHIYNCNNKRSDLCNISYETQILNNKYTRYNNKNEILKEVNTQPLIEDTSLRNYFDFIPEINNKYYENGIPYITEYVKREPFIIIKIINDADESNDTLEDTIHNFRKEMNIFEINVNLYLLNKNTKKIVDFTSRYNKESQYNFQSNFDRNEYIYDKNTQAYNIINREIIIDFYIKLLICLIIIIILFCVFLYYYNKDSFSKILLLGLILTGITIYLIFYNIFRHQHLDPYKYYYHQPENKYLNKIQNE